MACSGDLCGFKRKADQLEEEHRKLQEENQRLRRRLGPESPTVDVALAGSEAKHPFIRFVRNLQDPMRQREQRLRFDEEKNSCHVVDEKLAAGDGVMTANVIDLEEPWLIENAPRRLFVRECYPQLLKRMLDLLQLGRQNTGDFGARLLLTGTPGTSKSQFSTYMLWRLLQDRARSYQLIVDYDNAFAVIPPDGEVRILARNPYSPPVELSNPNSLYLFDARENTLPFGGGAIRAKMVVFSSPHELHFGAFQNKLPFELWMPLWPKAEIMFLRAACYSERDPQEVSDLYDAWGGTPRFTVVNDRRAADARLPAKLDRMSFERARDIAAGTRTVFVNGDDEVHSCMHAEATRGFELSHFKFASGKVRDHIMRAAAVKNKRAILDYLIGSLDDTKQATFYAQVFEWFAHWRLSQGGIFRQRELTARVESEVKWSDVEWSKTAVEDPYFDKFTDVANAVSGYYIPKAADFPVIDAFVAPRLLLIMTINLSHGALHAPLQGYVEALEGSDEVLLAFVVPAGDRADKYVRQSYLNAGGGVHQRVARVIKDRVRQVVVEMPFND